MVGVVACVCGCVDPDDVSGSPTTPSGSDAATELAVPDVSEASDTEPAPDEPAPADVQAPQDDADEPAELPVVDDAAPPPPPNAYAFDLDGDGTNDTDAALSACAEGTCVSVDSSLVPTVVLTLAPSSPICDGNLHGSELVPIGDHTGDGVSELAVPHCRHDGVEGPPALAVVDVALGVVIAAAQAPPEQDNAWVAAPLGPEGRRWPILAPSYGDGLNEKGNWGALCAFRPGLPSSPACGVGFVSVPSTPTPTAFREVGGTLFDLDGDGWEDITLIFHQLVHTLSGASLAPLQTVEFDVAATSEPESPKWFHSGRNYGTHVTHFGPGGTIRHAIVGGTPVGSFADGLCNVSRFVAVLESTAGQPQTRHLAWARYFGFSSTIFSAYDAAWATNPEAVVARPADVMDDCIHRFGDSRSIMDSQHVLVFNTFDQSAPIDPCVDEQYQLYLPPTWTDEKADAWYGCFAKNVTSPGTWGMQVLRESDGLPLTGSQGTYVWGMGMAIAPCADVTYLVEYLPTTTAFDLSDAPPSTIQVQALTGGLWTSKGTFPVAGRPALRFESASGARGVGSYTAFAELVTMDRDGDGLLEVQLESGTWVGWSGQDFAFIVKE